MLLIFDGFLADRISKIHSVAVERNECVFAQYVKAPPFRSTHLLKDFRHGDAFTMTDQDRGNAVRIGDAEIIVGSDLNIATARHANSFGNAKQV